MSGYRSGLASEAAILPSPRSRSASTADAPSLSSRRLAALRTAIDTLIAPVPHADPAQNALWTCSATGLGVDQALLTSLNRLPLDARRDFLRLLAFLSSPLPGLLAGGWPRSLAAMTPVQRETLFANWAISRFALFRMAFAALKRMTCFTAYSITDGEPNPNWSAIGYPGPPPRSEPPPGPAVALTSLRPDETSVDCDVLVIGSGAGGALTACTLAEKGHHVIVVDKGPYLPPAERSDLEYPMVSRLFEAGGMMSTRDHAFSLFAGSCLGGGTVVNWSVHWRPGKELLREWADEHALPQLLEPAFEDGIDEILRDLCVCREVPHNRQNRALLSGARALGYSHGALAQNVHGCERRGHEDCGFCMFGCRHATKQDAVETYLKRACRQGAALYADTTIRRLTRKAGRVTGAEAEIHLPDGRAQPIHIRAKRVVLAAGALHTPALLQRSGFDHPHIGRHLKIHPVALMLGRYAEPMESWHGGMMTSHCDELADLDGAGYGCRIETAPLHPGLLAAILPWRSGAAHKTAMSSAARYAAFAVITRDRFSEGRIRLNAEGNPRVDYALSAHDRRHLIEGMAAAAALHAAAGAETVHPTHHSAPVLPSAEPAPARETYKTVLDRLDWGPNRAPFFSAHLMGSCRMGGNRATSPVRPDGALADCDNLYVADGSLFPSPSGINPVLTIQALARHVAQGVATSLEESRS